MTQVPNHDQTERHDRNARRFGAHSPALCALLALLIVAACGKEDPGSTAASASPEDVLVRARVAAAYDNTVFEQARDLILPLVERPKPEAEDLVRMAAIQVRLFDPESARRHVQRALEIDPRHPGANYVMGRLAQEDFELDAAIDHYRRILEDHPDDLPTRLCLANALDEAERSDEAVALYEGILDVGVNNGGVW
jgi:tetratricopeptide (TPR) repeat protein